ncbi:MAG: flagellar hook capping FlgD N-terminal domain-containing protein [Pseudomonadota bacterium]
MSTLEQLASSSAAQVAVANSERDSQMLADDFDTFLQLLTTQLRNQDPLEPMDTNEFTNQLVQFSSVEQQIQSNSYLEQLITSSQAQAVNAVVGYLGATVTAEGVAANLSEGTATWSLNSDRRAEGSQVRIFDASGQQVFTTPLSVDPGTSEFKWDGIMDTGNPAPEGVYTIQVVGETANGSPVDVNTAVTGTVTSINVTGAEPILSIGDVDVRLSSIQSVDTGG